MTQRHKQPLTARGFFNFPQNYFSANWNLPLIYVITFNQEKQGCLERLRERKVPWNLWFQRALVRVTRFGRARSTSQTFWKDFFCLFLVLFSHFYSDSVTLWRSQNLRYPCIPEPSVVIHVVKNASRPKPAIFHRPGREAFSRFSLSAL